MKKVAYFLTLVLALTLINVSCCKDDDPANQTLAEMYPDWANLTWVSTDGASLVTTYPRLNITIIGDNGTINQPINATQSYNDNFAVMTVSGNNVTFAAPANVTGTFTKNGSQITLTTKGLSTTNHVYVLQIN